jgi:DNA-binding transcriptional MerR regulator
MEYSINNLAKLAGISSRTLRYYDEINLLKPLRINSSGYRIYGGKEVDTLHQILLYKELGFDLEVIKQIISSPNYDYKQALINHYHDLLNKQNQIEALIENVKKSIDVIEGRDTMSDQEKFKGFTKKIVAENEKNYGKEIREKYGNERVDKSNNKFLNMKETDYDYINKLTEEISKTLALAFSTKNPSSEEAIKLAKLHQEWIKFYWDEYTKEAHASLVKMYVQDERFKAFYDKIVIGGAEFLRDAVLSYLEFK